jgi:azurin
VRLLTLIFFCFIFMAGAEAADKENTFTIKAISGLQYDLKQFSVKPNAKVTIHFINDDATDMPHNMVFVKPGKRMDVVNMALAMGADAIATGFVPKSDDVIAAIPEVKPHGQASLTFNAPKDKGIYQYVCTYPGHGLIMFGDLYVGVPMPKLKEKSETPELMPHAYPLVRPYLYRLFMPDSNPASIALMLPGDINLCWDASSCRPRYLWRGDGVDISKYWKSNGAGRVALLGTKVWTAGEQMPLRLSTGISSIASFKGYTLRQGYPEFHYDLDSISVKELIREHDQGKGIDFTFETNSDKPLSYVVESAQNAIFSSSVGRFTNGILIIPAESAKSFIITLMPASKDSK